MLIQNLLHLAFIGLLAGINASPVIKTNTPLSTDGTCSSTVSCAGSGFGDCCSQYGFCGSGEAYCGTSSLSSAASSPTAPTSSSKMTKSTDGTCGNGVTCQDSGFGDCCSQYGYCGSTDYHCGSGCLANFGSCGSSGSGGKGSASAASPTSGKVASSAASKSTASAKAASSVKAAASSKASASVKAASTSSTSSACAATQTQLVVNPSFEDGVSPWTFGGGGSLVANGADTTWYLSTSAGTHYAQLVSSVSKPTSTVSQTLSFGEFQAGTLSFDWKYMVSSQSHGPPSSTCTLSVSFASGFITPASWSYPASQGGGGHVETTFQFGIGGGDMTFTFSCSNLASTFQGAALIDNVKFTGACV